MQIRVGFEMTYDCPQPTPMILHLNVHFSRVQDLVGRDNLTIDPPVSIAGYHDSFGNWCTRIVAPKGRTRICADAIVNDTGAPDAIVPEARQLPVPELPDETLLFLLGSRYCETDRLSDTAWGLFGHGADRLGARQAICDYVHRHITFGYEHARNTRTAFEAWHDRTGVCRDYAHLAVALLPMHEHPGALLHRLSGRHRRSAAARHDGFCRVVRGISRWPVAYFRCAQQRAEDRAGADRARPRRVGRRHQQHVRSEHAREFQGVDR
mgnify:CR=1 FL=1